MEQNTSQPMVESWGSNPWFKHKPKVEQSSPNLQVQVPTGRFTAIWDEKLH